MIGQFLTIASPPLIAIGVGYAMARLNPQTDEPEYVTVLITNIGAPCLVFSTLATVELSAAAVMTVSGAALANIIAAALIGYLLLRLTGLSIRGYLPSLIHANSGNMGLPLALFAFGEEGLVLGVAYYITNSISQYTVTPCIASGGLSVNRLVRSPIIYVVAASLAVLVTRTTVPQWLIDSTRLLAGMTIPLLLVTLGYSLARLRVERLWTSLALSAVRLGMGFVIAVAITEAIGLQGTARGVVILQSSMPVAVFNYLFAKQYDAEPAGVASMVVVSTILSFVTLPFLLWYVL